MSLAPRIGLGITLLASAGVAQAAKCDIDVVEFSSAITSVRLSLGSGYASGAARVVNDLHDRVSCLRFPPPPKLWADWLFLVALTRYAEGRTDWKSPLDRALVLNPALDRRMVGKNHDLRRYTALPPSTGTHTLPYDRDDVTIYVDGVRVATTLTDPDGLHLVQINNGSWWDSRLIDGGQQADDLWVPRRQPQPVRLRVQGFGAGGLGGARWKTAPDDGDFVEHDPITMYPVAVGVRGQVTVGHLAFRAQVTYDQDGQVPLYWAVGVDRHGFGVGLGATAERWVSQKQAIGSSVLSLREHWYPNVAIAAWVDPPHKRRTADAWVYATTAGFAGNAGIWPQLSKDPVARYRLGISGSLRCRQFLLEGEGSTWCSSSTKEGRHHAKEAFVGLELAVEVVRVDHKPPAPWSGGE